MKDLGAYILYMLVDTQSQRSSSITNFLTKHAHTNYLPSKMFEVIRVTDAAQLTVWLAIRIKALHNKL